MSTRIHRRKSSLAFKLSKKRRSQDSSEQGTIRKRHKSKTNTGPLRNVTNETRNQIFPHKSSSRKTRQSKRLHRERQEEIQQFLAQGEELTDKLKYLEERQEEAALDMALLSARQSKGFQDKFDELKGVGRSNAITIAVAPVNALKNRYRNVLPYDHSLVQLKVDKEYDEASGYINANYIHGYLQHGAYIATQGPLAATKSTFWRMVWEHESNTVVMLTKLMEKDKPKCAKYWPDIADGNKMKFGRLSVKIISTVRQTTYTTRTFLIKCGRKSREVRHHQFTEWDDKLAPNSLDMLDFCSNVRHVRVTGPLIVHCSAGVGRSGTYIAADQILARIEHRDQNIDIYNMVKDMRLRRVSMVQTIAQYSFLYKFYADALATMVDDAKTQLDSFDALKRVSLKGVDVAEPMDVGQLPDIMESNGDE